MLKFLNDNAAMIAAFMIGALAGAAVAVGSIADTVETVSDKAVSYSASREEEYKKQISDLKDKVRDLQNVYVELEDNKFSASTVRALGPHHIHVTYK